MYIYQFISEIFSFICYKSFLLIYFYFISVHWRRTSDQYNRVVVSLSGSFRDTKNISPSKSSLETTSKQHNNTLSLSCNYWYLGNSSECRLKERGVAGGFRKLQHIEYWISWFQIISDFWYCPAIETSNCEIILF